MFAALIAALALALPSAPAGRCFLDTAHAVTDFQAQVLEQACEKVDKSGAGQIAIVIVNDLQGLNRPEYASALFKAWGIGHKGKDDGLLILLALPPADRGVKVEIGYGLEGRLNDGKVMAAVRERALPKFKAGQYAEGLLALVAYYEGEMQAERIEQIQQEPAKLAAPSSSPDPLVIFFIVVLSVAAVAGGIWLAVYLARKKEEQEERERRARAEAERLRNLVPRAEKLLKTRDDIERQDRERLQFFVDHAKPIIEPNPAPAYVPPAPEPAPAPVVHHRPATRRRSSSDDSHSSSSRSSYEPSSSPSPSYDSGSFGGFGGGSSGGGGGDAGF
jgi:uncharacterized protein